MATYNIKKSYEGFPSKTQQKYESGLTYEEATSYLDGSLRSWKRNGGLVISNENDVLVVEEGDGSNTITFEIVEIEENN